MSTGSNLAKTALLHHVIIQFEMHLSTIAHKMYRTRWSLLNRLKPVLQVLEPILIIFGCTRRGSAWSAYVHKTLHPMYVYRVATSIMDVVNPV